MAVIRSLTTQAIVADHAEVASGVLQRMVGLLHRASLREGEALILPRCNAIHTCFMRFPIDALFLKTTPAARSTQGTVLRVVSALPPFRLAWARRADTVVELPVGTIARTKTKVGELLDIT